MFLPLDLERLVGGDRLARFVDAPLTREDLAGEDQRLGARAAFDQAAIDQRLIGTLLGSCGHAPSLEQDPVRRNRPGCPPAQLNCDPVPCYPGYGLATRAAACRGRCLANASLTEAASS